MPELPEVETVRRGLLSALRGRRLVEVTQRRLDLRFPFPERFAERLAGRRVEDIERFGKYLLIYLDDHAVWLAHLGMSGRFRVEAPGQSVDMPHDHVVIRADDGATIRYNDPRRFGFMDLFPAEEKATHPMLRAIGPDPYGPAFTVDHLVGAFARRAASPIKPAMLDQSVIAGMGNIYASESLFHARLSPMRLASTVASREIVERLREAILQVFTRATEAGGSSLRDHRQPSGELGYFQHQFAVYGREGERCPGCACGDHPDGGIRRIVQTGRSTFFCMRRQR